MTDADDGRLYELLTRALEVPNTVPPASGLNSLHRAVAQRAEALRERELSATRPRLAWLRRPIPALAGLLVLTSVGTAGAIATGTTLPRPVREVAHAIGLPVDSPALAEARTTLGRLLDAIERRDLPAVQSLAPELEAALDGMSGEDRSKISDNAEEALDRARALLGEPTGPDTRSGVEGGDGRDTSGPGGGDDSGGDSGNSEDSEDSSGPAGPDSSDGMDEPDSSGSGSDGVDEPDSPDEPDSSNSGSDSVDEPDSPDEPDSSGSGSDSFSSDSGSDAQGSDSSEVSM